MANNFASISSATSGVLKTYFAGVVKSQLNDEVPLYRGSILGTEKWFGQQVNRALKVRRNQGIGASSDGGTLPSIGRQTVVQAIIASKFNWLRKLNHCAA